MLGGRYFYLCIDSSSNERKVFRYNQIASEQNNCDLNPKIHPFFIIFNESSIDFCENADKEVGGMEIHHFQVKFKIPVGQIPFRDGDLANYLINYFDDILELSERLDYKPKENAFVFSQKNETITLTYRIIFQHFLYDILYHDIFQNDRLYTTHTFKLFENYFIKCIAAKGDYLYWQNEFTKLRNDKDKTSNEYILKRYWEADKEWVKLITDERQNEILNVSNEWFKAPEIEIKKVLGVDQNTALDKIEHLNLIKELVSNVSSLTKNYRKEIHIQRDDIYSFYLYRFNNYGLDNILSKYHDYYTQVNYIVLFIYIFYLLFQFNLISDLPWIILIVFYYFIFADIFYKNKKIDIYSFTILIPTISFIFIIKNQSNLLVLILFLLFVFGSQQNILRQIFYLIRKFLYPEKVNYFSNSIGFPKMSLAILAVWIGFIPICDEAWALNVNIKSNWVSVSQFVGFIFLVLGSIFYFVNKSIFDLKISFGRSIGIFLHGLSISVLLGIFAMEVSRENLFTKIIEFFPDERGVYEISILDSTSSNLQKELDLNISANKPINFSLINQNMAFLRDSLNYGKIGSFSFGSTLLNNYDIDSLTALRKTIDSIKLEKIASMADLHTEKLKKYDIPAIKRFEMYGKSRYVFPKLLLIYALFAFYIGLFVEVAFKGTRYKENL